MKFIISFIKSVDLFSYKPSLKYKQTRSFKTVLSGIISIILIITLITATYFIFLNSADISLKNMYISENYDYITNSSFTNGDKLNIKFQFHEKDSNNIIPLDNSIFEFNIFLIEKDKEYYDKVLNKTIISYKDCNQSICIDNFMILRNCNIINEVSIQIEKCLQDSSTNHSICKNNTIVDTILSNSYLMITYEFFQLNLLNGEKAFTQYSKYQIIDLNLLNNFSTRLDNTLLPVNYNIDNNLFFSNYDEQVNLIEYDQFNYYANPIYNKSQIEINISLSDKTLLRYISYEKVLKTLVPFYYIIVQLVFFILSLIFKTLNRRMLLITLRM